MKKILTLFSLIAFVVVLSGSSLENSQGDEALRVDSLERWYQRARDPEAAMLYAYPLHGSVPSVDTSQNDGATDSSPLTIEQLVSSTYVDDAFFDMQVTYVITNQSNGTISGIALQDSCVSISSGEITTVPGFVGTPLGTITLNSSWDGISSGDPQILDSSASSLLPGESVTIRYALRVGALNVVEDGYVLRGSVSADGIDGQNGETIVVVYPPGPLQTAAAIQAFQVVDILEATPTTTKVRIYFIAQNTNIPGGPPPVPTCGGINPAGLGAPVLSYTSAIVDTLADYVVAPSTFVVNGDPVVASISQDLDGDGDRPVPGINLGWLGTAATELSSHLCSFVQLGAGEFFALYHDVTITHNGDTTWSNRIWASCICPTCLPNAAADDDLVNFQAPAAAAIASRMTLSAVGGIPGAHTVTCTTFVRNPGPGVIEKMNVKVPLAAAFAGGTDAITSVSDPTSKLFPAAINASFSGGTNDSLLISDAALEMTAGQVDTLTFDILFDEGNVTEWFLKNATKANADGGSPSLIDSTNCGGDDDFDDDMIYDEVGDNDVCSWQVDTDPTILQPEDLVHIGAFKFPGTFLKSQGPAVWFAGGDPGGAPDDTLDGSLFAISGFNNVNNMKVAEFKIPNPSMTTAYDSLPTMTMIGSAVDVFDAQVTYGTCSNLGMLDVGGGNYRFYTTECKEFDTMTGTNKSSHLAFDYPLSANSSEGPWSINWPTLNIHTTNRWLFNIDPSWAAKHTPGKTLACGWLREGQGPEGPPLIAFAPWTGAGGTEPADGANLDTSAKKLIFYDPEDSEADSMSTHMDGDRWTGGNWYNDGNKSAVMLICRKGFDCWWYGYRGYDEGGGAGIWPHVIRVDSHCCDVECGGPHCLGDENCRCVPECDAFNPLMPCDSPTTGWCPDLPTPHVSLYCGHTDECVEYWGGQTDGYVADRYRIIIALYSPDDLGDVADNLVAPDKIQPYAFVDVTQYMFAYRSGLATLEDGFRPGVICSSTDGYVFISGPAPGFDNSYVTDVFKVTP